MEEQSLELALVVVVGGSQPLVSTTEVKRWLQTHHGISEDRVTIKLYYPKDFLIIFSSPGDLVQLLHHPQRRRLLCRWCPSVECGSCSPRWTSSHTGSC
jgi:hypothetical protein